MFSNEGNLIFASAIISHVLLGKFHRFAATPPKLVYHKTKRNEQFIERCSALFNFKPTPLYALDHYGFLQTLGQTFLKSFGRVLSSVRYNRENFRLSDGGTVGLDWVQSVGKTSVKLLPDAPTVIIQHGLCGDSNVEYVIHLVELLSRLNYRVVVMIARGCGGMKLSTDIPFTFGETLDFKEVVDHIHRIHPNSKLLAVGFSLGACLTLRHVAVHADTTPLHGALCVSPPWDFDVAPTKIFQLFWTKILVSALKLYYWLNRDSIDPELLSQIYAAESMYAYHDIIAPRFGYESRFEYYKASSPKFFTNKIKVPTLAISSVDDPICNVMGAPQSISTGRVGTGLIIAIVELGGHLGFAEDWLPFRTSWIDRVCIDWFDALLNSNVEEIKNDGGSATGWQHEK